MRPCEQQFVVCATISVVVISRAHVSAKGAKRSSEAYVRFRVAAHTANIFCHAAAKRAGDNFLRKPFGSRVVHTKTHRVDFGKTAANACARCAIFLKHENLPTGYSDTISLSPRCRRRRRRSVYVFSLHGSFVLAFGRYRERAHTLVSGTYSHSHIYTQLVASLDLGPDRIYILNTLLITQAIKVEPFKIDF